MGMVLMFEDRIDPVMPRYKNIARKSGVDRYEIGAGYIDVWFAHDGGYRYTNESAGPENIAEMQRLALLGRGLATFINRHVRARYERKLGHAQ